MVVGKKYKIIGHCDEYTGIEQNQYFNLLFANVKSHLNHNNVLFSTYMDFYEFVPQTQAKMERRAVNLIIQRLLGDDCFEW